MDFRILGSPERFEKLCKLLLLKEDPNMQTLDGRPGDEGKDSFLGTFAKSRVIFQIKYFETLERNQRKQIEASLERASKSRPEKWILLISVEFTKYDWQWFEGLGKRYSTIGLDVWQAPKIATLVLDKKNEGLREIFPELFPVSTITERAMARLEREKIRVVLVIGLAVLLIMLRPYVSWKPYAVILGVLVLYWGLYASAMLYGVFSADLYPSKWCDRITQLGHRSFRFALVMATATIGLTILDWIGVPLRVLQWNFLAVGSFAIIGYFAAELNVMLHQAWRRKLMAHLRENWIESVWFIIMASPLLVLDFFLRL